MGPAGWWWSCCSSDGCEPIGKAPWGSEGCPPWGSRALCLRGCLSDHLSLPPCGSVQVLGAVDLGICWSLSSEQWLHAFPRWSAELFPPSLTFPVSRAWLEHSDWGKLAFNFTDLSPNWLFFYWLLTVEQEMLCRQ